MLMVARVGAMMSLTATEGTDDLQTVSPDLANI